MGGGILEMNRTHTIKIGNKSLGTVSEFTGTVTECLTEITRLENELNTPLQHYEKETKWRIIGGVFQKPK